MNKILITILIITGFLIYKMISSSRRQEGYKRWKATGGGKEEKVDKTKWERGYWLRHAMGVTTPVAPYTPRFEKEAVIWCAALLGVEVNRLEEILNNVSGHYQEFWMRKRSGGYRMISAPDKDLQAIQSTIYSRILSSVTIVHPAAVGFRCGRSVVDNAAPHLGKRYVLKMDIHDFFGSIRSPRVRQTFKKIGYPENVSKVLGALCCLHRHLPQGAPTSPALSNIVGYEMDRKLAALAAEYGLTYTRYADDLTFSGDVFPKEQIIPQVKRIIRDEKFEPNHKKTHFMNQSSRKIITGVSVASGVKLTIPKSKKREIRKNVYFILTKGLAEHQRRIGSHDPAYLKRLIGMLCYWRAIEPDNTYASDSIAALKRLEKGY
ncbi:MAG: RNA-directed DNA polymerase [Bacteroides caccae]|nr:RNA-directed DNA polymerase [Bacteroides caccae]